MFGGTLGASLAVRRVRPQDLVRAVMRLRHEAARLLDFPSYAEYALADRMAHTVGEVTTFLRELAAAARASAAAELAELEAYAGRPLEAWDITY